MPRHAPNSLLFCLLCSGAIAASPSSEVPPQVVPVASVADTRPSMMTLEHAYDIAASSDQALRKAFVEVKKAELLPMFALTGLTPRLTGTTKYARNYTSYSSPDGPSQHSGVGVAGLSLTQPLLDLTVFPARRKGKLAVESARLGRQFTIRETLFGVAQAYFDVLKGERIVAVDRQSLLLAQEQQSLAQKRADVGEVTRSDVLRAQVSVETARRVLITAENTLEYQRNTLRNILNLPYDAPLRLAEPLPYRQDLPAFGPLLASAYERREDLRESELAVQQAEQARAQIRAQYAPSIVAEGGPQVTHSSGFDGSHSTTWAGDIRVQIPIFSDGGQRELNLVNARLLIEQAVLDKQILIKSIEAQVKQAWLDVQTWEESLRAVKTQVKAAEQSYADLQNQYKAGTATSVDVLSALQDLNKARLDFASLSLEYEVKLRALEQANGTFQDQRVRQIMEPKR